MTQQHNRERAIGVDGTFAVLVTREMHGVRVERERRRLRRNLNTLTFTDVFTVCSVPALFVVIAAVAFFA